jgi:hypothetical protein
VVFDAYQALSSDTGEISFATIAKRKVTPGEVVLSLQIYEESAFAIFPLSAQTIEFFRIFKKLAGDQYRPGVRCFQNGHGSAFRQSRRRVPNLTKSREIWGRRGNAYYGNAGQFGTRRALPGKERGIMVPV